MCTVTYIPQEGNNFILTSNRDENAKRSPQNISIIETQKKVRLAFPRDKGAGGSWIAMSGDNRVVCLLNGAFEKHERKEYYRRSRGLMLLDYFEFTNTESFLQQYNFENMEAFTMIIVDKGRLFEYRWDEKSQYIKTLSNNKQYIWSSATLYHKTIREKRQKWFRDWRKSTTNYYLEDILDFHHSAGDGDCQNDVVMNRSGIVQTVSITSIIKYEHNIQMHYNDLVTQQIKQAKINLHSEMVETN